jgi:progressive ankylosis protein
LVTGDALTGRKIFKFYLPLALSWLFMGLEGPVCVAVISHLRNPEINAAAFYIMMALAIWIEAPVIDLLATSTTLAKDRARYALISKFVWWLMVWVTVAHAAVTFTPLYWTVTQGIMGVDEAVAVAARPGMMVMTFWSAFIGWRRYLQGIMIRSGQTRPIGIGTTMRVSTISLTALVLFFSTNWNGLLIASVSLLLSVIVESLFIHWASRDAVAKLPPASDGEPLSLRRLLAFHFPMTATTMVKLLVSPIIAAGLARTPNPVTVLAAMQVAGSVIFLFRALGFCLPEVVIALYRDEATRRELRNFCLKIAFGTSGTMLLLSFTGLDRLFFGRVLGAPAHVVEIAHWIFMLSAMGPFLDAAQSYVRGVLTAHHLTLPRLQAVFVSVGVLVGTIALGLRMGWSGPVIAASSLSLSLAAELAWLVFAWLRAKVTLAPLASR